MKNSLHRRRSRITLVMGVAILFTMLFAREHIARFALTYGVMHASAPSEKVMTHLLKTSDDAQQFLSQLWNEGGIPHRQFVVHAVQRPPGDLDRRQLFQSLQPIVTEALCDGDESIQITAINIYRAQEDPTAISLAWMGLHDPDPEVRYAWITYVYEFGTRRDAQRVIPILRDDNSFVRVIANAALRNWLHSDVQIKVRMSEAEREKVVADWQQRVEDESMQDESESGMPMPAEEKMPRRPFAADITLPDLHGRTIRLREYRGKPILITFWKGCIEGCLQTELREFEQIHRTYSDRLQVIGVALDGVPDLHGHEHYGDKSLHGLRKQITSYIDGQDVTFRVAIDKEGDMMAAYAARLTPTTVLIDAEGRLVRRLQGKRPDGILTQIIQNDLETIQSRDDSES